MLNFLPSSHPLRTLPASSLFPTTLLVRMKESWVAPGHLATIFVRRIWASHIICTFIEWKCFLFTYAYFPSDGVFIPICVQSIAPITFGKPAIAANSALMFDWLISSKYGLWLLHATPTTLVSLSYCQELSDKHLMGDLLAWMTSTVLKICNV